ncbi:MAG TPA: hypothetical protein PLR99_25350, partial [Polyangiaceae bacterium]|nr:hypothetical protein [Polyangiaceae bacterium]
MRIGALVAVGAFAALAAACSSTVVSTTSDGVGDDASTPADTGTGVTPRDASTGKDSAAPDAAPPRDAAPPPPVDAA